MEKWPTSSCAETFRHLLMHHMEKWPTSPPAETVRHLFMHTPRGPPRRPPRRGAGPPLIHRLLFVAVRQRLTSNHEPCTHPPRHRDGAHDSRARCGPRAGPDQAARHTAEPDCRANDLARAHAGVRRAHRADRGGACAHRASRSGRLMVQRRRRQTRDPAWTRVGTRPAPRRLMTRLHSGAGRDRVRSATP